LADQLPQIHYFKAVHRGFEVIVSGAMRFNKVK